MMHTFQITTLLLLVATTLAFTVPQGGPRLFSTRKNTVTLFLSSGGGKGFGSTPPPPPKKTQEENKTPSVEEAELVDKTTTPPPPPAKNTPDISTNMGQRALANMRRQQAEKKDAELRKVREIRSVDEFVRDDPSAAVIPEKVAMRMGSRMLPFVGIPLFGGMAAFVAFWYLATYKNMEFQPAMVATTTVTLLVVGLLGITYSVMSASWDPDREGSALGTEEFSKNIESLKDGMKRSRENLIIRERMAGMPEAEIEAAIRDLDKREAQEMKKAQSLETKLEKEME